MNELLDISRLERGKLTVSTQPVDLVTMTREVLAETDVLVQERRHRVSVSTGDHPLPAVRADAQLLRQVVMNLVSNAIKYTPEGGAIEVRFERDGDTLRWSIRDSGIGIPRSSQARLFEKFYRAENVSTLETEGTGLGFYLVRLIMEQLDGRVWCESEEGAGSTFRFTLPLAELAEGRRAGACSWAIGWPGSWRVDPMGDAVRRVLLAEDDRFLRKAAETALKRHGFTVVAAVDGEEALRLARAAPPDLVLLDLIMPRMQGFEVLRALKADPATAPIPVVILSNLGQDGDMKQAMDAGAAAQRQLSTHPSSSHRGSQPSSKPRSSK